MKTRLLVALLTTNTLLMAPPGGGGSRRTAAPLHRIFDNKKANHQIEQVAQERQLTPTLQGSLFPLELVAYNPARQLFQLAATQQGFSGRCGWHALINTISMLKLMECYKNITHASSKEDKNQHVQSFVDAAAFITTYRKTALCDQLWPQIQRIRQALKLRVDPREEGVVIEEISHLIKSAASCYQPTQLPTQTLTSLISVIHANECSAKKTPPAWLEELIDRCTTSTHFMHGFIMLYDSASTSGFSGYQARDPHYISVVIIKQRGTVSALITNSMPEVVINRACIQEFVALFNQKAPASTHRHTASYVPATPRKTVR